MPKQQRGRLSGHRSHRKSRNGCSGCKKRHIKCVETRPECRNCVMGDMTCPYLTTSSTSSRAHIRAPPSSVVSNHLPVVPGKTQDGALHSEPTFTVTHMTFFRYAMTNMSEFMALQVDAQPVIDTALENAYAAPYLLYQVLALSAFHLSTQDMAQALPFRHQATELQTRALDLFNHAKHHISEDTCLSTFLFASLLGVQVLYETLNQHYGTPADFLDSFISYLRLHRGVQAVTTNYWHRILESNLQPLMQIPLLSKQIELEIPGEETKSLRGFLESSSTSSTSSTIKACLSALDQIQWVLEMTKQESSASGIHIHAVMAWPLVIFDEYIQTCVL